jgi:hypothetical protein
MAGAPRILSSIVIRGHNHLSQVYSLNTGDESLSGSMTAFTRRHL